MATRPRSWKRVPLPRRKAKTPTAISTGKTTVTSKESTCTMSVVPILAPSMTASAGTRSTAPAPTREVVISAVAVEDCSAAVTPSPARKRVEAGLQPLREAAAKIGAEDAHDTALHHVDAPEEQRDLADQVDEDVGGGHSGRH